MKADTFFHLFDSMYEEGLIDAYTLEFNPDSWACKLTAPDGRWLQFKYEYSSKDVSIFDTYNPVNGNFIPAEMLTIEYVRGYVLDWLGF